MISVLEGSRLVLEPLAREHGEGMFELWRHPEVSIHSGPCVDAAGERIPMPARSRADSDRLLDYWLERAREATGCRWAVVLRGQDAFVGAVGFNGVGARCEYAYHLIPRFWGRGLAFEASELALAWAASSGSIEARAFIEPENQASIRLVERLGFRRVGAATPLEYALDLAEIAARAAPTVRGSS